MIGMLETPLPTTDGTDTSCRVDPTLSIGSRESGLTMRWTGTGIHIKMHHSRIFLQIRDTARLMRNIERKQKRMEVLLWTRKVVNGMNGAKGVSITHLESHKLQGNIDISKFESFPKFMSQYPRLFEFDPETDIVRCRGFDEQATPATEDDVAQALQILVPACGWVSLRGVAIALVSTEDHVQAVIEGSEALRAKYAVDKHSIGLDADCGMICTQEWTDKIRWFSVTDDASLQILPIMAIFNEVAERIPSYWVPMKDVIDGLSPETKLLLSSKKRLERTFSLFSPVDVVKAIYNTYGQDGAIYIRRVGACASLPPCTASYPPYIIPPEHLMTIARSIEKKGWLVELDVFLAIAPRVRQWLNGGLVGGKGGCAFTMYDFVKMYPQVFEKKRDKLSSGNYKGLTTFFKSVPFPDSSKLLAACSMSPPDTVFIPHFYKSSKKDTFFLGEKMTTWTGVEKTYSDEEMLEIVKRVIPELEVISCFEAGGRILDELKDEEARILFFAGIYQRHGKLNKYLKSLTEHFKVEEATPNEWVITRNDGATQDAGAPENEFVDSDAIVQALIEAIKRLKSKKKQGEWNDRVWLDSLQQHIPEKARKAAKLLGGLQNIVRANTEIFAITEDATGKMSLQWPKPAPPPIRERVEAMFTTYAPEKVAKLDSIMAKYAGNEEDFLEYLVWKYGPEPPWKVLEAVPGPFRKPPGHKAWEFKAFVGNISWGADDSATTEFIKKYGPTSIEIYNTGKGHSLVKFGTAEELATFIEEISGKEFLGRAVTAEIGRNRQTEHKAFIGNISRDVDDTATTEFIKKYGNPIAIINSGKSYSFAKFGTAEEMQSFVDKINGEELCGQRVRAENGDRREQTGKWVKPSPELTST